MVRENAAKGREDMLDEYGCSFGHLEYESAEPEERKRTNSTFSLRLLLSLVILGVFLWTHMEKKSVLGYQPEKVVEAVSQNTDLQALSKSVRMEK